MSVDAFTVDGKVTLDTTPFDTAIGELVGKLNELKEGLSNLGIHTQSFTNEIGVADKQFDDLKGSATGVNDEITSMASGLGNALKETSTLNSDLNLARENISSLRNETSTLVYDFGQFTTDLGNAVGMAQALTSEFSSMRYYVDMVKAESEGLLQLEKEKEALMHKNKMDALTNRQTLISEADERNRIQLMEVEKELQEEMIHRIEREAQTRMKLREETIEGYQMGLHYLEQQHQAETLLYDDIIKRYEAQGKLVTTVQEQLGILAERNAQDESDIAFLEEQLVLQKEINSLVAQGGAENIKQAEALMKQLQTDTEVFTILEEEIALEKEKLALLEEQDAVLKKQTVDREKQLVSSQKGNKLDKMGYLPSRIGSMALTMWGFNELMDVYDKTMGHINAESQKDYFAKRMGMNSKATQDFTNQLNNMQKTYKKLDMTVVGANALETATKYKVQEQSLGDLTEVMAIYGSEFVKQGRSQEDSILAINDALDGELRRLKEVGIGAEELKATGLWNGDESDKEGMLKALLQIAQERGYDKTAKDITNLSDAITTLEVKLSIDLARAFGVIEPLITDVLGNFVTMLEALEKGISWVTPKITEFAKAIGLIDKDGKATQFGNFLEDWVSWMITFGITAYGVYKIAKPLLGMFGKLKDVGGGIAEGTGDVGKTMNTGGFKENFKSEWGKLGKNLGKMARVFVEFAVALAMAWALIEEAILLISAIGYTYESLKPQFNQGIEFIKEFGVWFALLGGAMLGLSYAIGQIPQGVEKAITKGATRLAYGMAIAIGLIAEAIVLLIAPMTAIALLGGTASFLGTNLDKGLEVISWIGNALHQIDLPVALFIGGFLAISLLLGLVQPLTLALAVGIASALALVTEAIGLLILPLTAIALLGGTASMLGEDKIQQGAETIKMIGNVLQVLAQAIPYLLVVDLTIFGVQLVEWGNRLLSGGKDGLTTLVQDILPTIQTFISDFNGLNFSETLDTAKITAITTVATQLPPLFTAIQKLNNAMGTSDALGNIGGALGGSISGAIGMGLKSKLDQLYNDVKDVMDFATKLGGLSTGNGGNTTAIQQTANAIAQLKVKLNLLITTISSASSRVQSASQRLGSAVTTGFKTGTASFNSTVVSTLAKGISEVQSRYNTWHSGGKASAQKLTDGFKTFGGKIRATIRTEMNYALRELESYQDDFYRKGQALGKQLSDGFESSGGLNVGSPANIARTIAKEMEYSMLALDNGKQLMYKGGQALGQALTNGYNSYGNLRTDVGVLAQKGVSNEQLQANAKNTQLNGNHKGQNPQLTQTNINIDMSNSTVIGVQDLDNKIRQAVEKAIVSMNSPNGAIGY